MEFVSGQELITAPFKPEHYAGRLADRLLDERKEAPQCIRVGEGRTSPGRPEIPGW